MKVNAQRCGWGRRDNWLKSKKVQLTNLQAPHKR